MSRRRVALLCRGGHGGSTVFAAELAVALARLGDDVVLASATPLGRPPRTHADALRRIECAGSDGLVQAVAAAGPFDVVHAHFARPLARTALDLARRLAADGVRPRVVATLHGTDVTALEAGSAETAELIDALSRVDHVVAVSADLRAAAERLGIGTARTVIYGGVDLERWTPDATLDRPEFVHVSTLQPLKRVPALIDAFARARQLGLDRRVRLRIVGDGPDGPRARQVARARRLGDAVQFCGARPLEPRDVRGARAVVSYSECESFGLSLLEGLACGVPLVTTDPGGVAELLGDADVGAVGRSPESFALALVRLGCGVQPALRRRARARAEQFPIEGSARRYQELYRQ